MKKTENGNQAELKALVFSNSNVDWDEKKAEENWDLIIDKIELIKITDDKEDLLIWTPTQEFADNLNMYIEGMENANPVSYVEKGKELEIKENQEFVMSFKIANDDNEEDFE